MEQFKKRMEDMRSELNKLMEEIDTCDKGRLLELSRELDKIIIEYIHCGENEKVI